MIRGRMSKTLSNPMMAMVLAAGIFLCNAVLPGTGLKDSPGRSVGQYGQYATLLPNEVIVYEHADFVGKYDIFRLEPGMRQKLVPDLKNFNDVISSIQVGSNVGVMVFEHGIFRDHERLQGWIGAADAGNPSYNVYRDSQKVLPEDMNDNISSLIVFRKGLGAVGVMLTDDRSGHDYPQFFPLPELEIDTEAKYPALGPMDDDANWAALYPNSEMVRVTLYEHPDYRGRWITLPGAGGNIPGLYHGWQLGNYSFSDTASSVIVRWIGPPPPVLAQPSIQAPSTSTHVVAPPAPDTKQAPVDMKPLPPASESKKAPLDKTAPLPPVAKSAITSISGKWNSNIGAIYEIQQSGTNFTWSAPSLNQSGTGTVSGNIVTMSGPGWTVKGMITEADSSGQPTKIVGENGVILFRAAASPAVPAPPPAQQPIPSPPPTLPVTVNPLSGQWNSNIGTVYEIQQSGNTFTWSAPSLNQSGTGTISGTTVTMSGPGWIVKGTVTETDASGKPIKIVGENGVILFRSASGKD